MRHLSTAFAFPHCLDMEWCKSCHLKGSYVALVLALEALLHSALSLVSFALKDFALPDEALVDVLVSILGFAELCDDAGSGFRGYVTFQPSNVLDLCLCEMKGLFPSSM